MNDKAKKDVCFIVSPIGAKGSESRTHADWVFNGIIIPAFAAFPDFHIERSDHISTPGQINAQVIDRLLNSRLVIADLSMLNPNVFYEIGIRHMVEKPIIHLQREDDPIPFDVAIYRAIKFSLKEYADLEAAQTLLARMIADVLAPEYVTNNPVTEARGRVKLKESATPEQQILIEDMASMKARLSFLESQQNLHSMMIDPTISIPNNVYWKNHSLSDPDWRRTEMVIRNPPFTKKIRKLLIDVNATGVKRDEILKLVHIETSNFPDISIEEDDQGMIEVMGQQDDMRRLYRALRDHIGQANVVLVGG